MILAFIIMFLMWRRILTTCPECAVNDQQQAARLKLEAIKQQILSKLHLQEKPNITTPLAREVALEALRRTQGGIPDEAGRPPEENETGIRDDYYARTSEIIAFAEPGQSLNGHFLLDFYPHEYLNSKLRVTAATLWIQLRYSPTLPVEARAQLRNKHVTLYAFRVGNSTEQLSHVTSYHQGTAHAGWRRLDVGEVVQQWLSGNESREKLTLLVDCTGCNSKLEMVLFNEEESSNFSNYATATATTRRIRHGGHDQQLISLRPFLAVATEATEQKRSRRHSRTCGETPSNCCKKNLYVSFKDLGWGDWIIAPKGYYANFCMGNCIGRRTYASHHNFHSHIIEEYRNRNPYASIQPCCAPTKLSSMSLIYFDADMNIIKTDLPKMIVDECGCI